MCSITIVYKNGSIEKIEKCFDIRLDGIDIVFFTKNNNGHYIRHFVCIHSTVESIVISN